MPTDEPPDVRLRKALVGLGMYAHEAAFLVALLPYSDDPKKPNVPVLASDIRERAHITADQVTRGGVALQKLGMVKKFTLPPDGPNNRRRAYQLVNSLDHLLMRFTMAQQERIEILQHRLKENLQQAYEAEAELYPD
jgi:hypothetical protein